MNAYIKTNNQQPTTYNLQSRYGFTFVEVAVAVLLFGAVSAAVASFAAYYFRNYSFSYEQSQSIGIAQVALTRMIREIRESRNGDDGSWPIIEANDNSFTFYSDEDGDGRSDRIRYFLDGTDLKRGVIPPTTVPVTYPAGNEVITIVASYLTTSTGSIFAYYNANWPSDTVNNPLSLANRQLNTRYVQVKIRVNITNNFGSQPFDLQSGTSIRSLKTNL